MLFFYCTLFTDLFSIALPFLDSLNARIIGEDSENAFEKYAEYFATDMDVLFFTKRKKFAFIADVDGFSTEEQQNDFIFARLLQKLYYEIFKTKTKEPSTEVQLELKEISKAEIVLKKEDIIQASTPLFKYIKYDSMFSNLIYFICEIPAIINNRLENDLLEFDDLF